MDYIIHVCKYMQGRWTTIMQKVYYGYVCDSMVMCVTTPAGPWILAFKKLRCQLPPFQRFFCKNSCYKPLKAVFQASIILKWQCTIHFHVQGSRITIMQKEDYGYVCASCICKHVYMHTYVHIYSHIPAHIYIDIDDKRNMHYRRPAAMQHAYTKKTCTHVDTHTHTHKYTHTYTDPRWVAHASKTASAT